jgi:hypothetical protein
VKRADAGGCVQSVSNPACQLPYQPRSSGRSPAQDVKSQLLVSFHGIGRVVQCLVTVLMRDRTVGQGRWLAAPATLSTVALRHRRTARDLSELQCPKDGGHGCAPRGPSLARRSTPSMGLVGPVRVATHAREEAGDTSKTTRPRATLPSWRLVSTVLSVSVLSPR